MVTSGRGEGRRGEMAMLEIYLAESLRATTRRHDVLVLALLLLHMFRDGMLLIFFFF